MRQSLICGIFSCALGRLQIKYPKTHYGLHMSCNDDIDWLKLAGINTGKCEVSSFDLGLRGLRATDDISPQSINFGVT